MTCFILHNSGTKAPADVPSFQKPFIDSGEDRASSLVALTLALRHEYLQSSLRMLDLPHPSLQVTKIGQFGQIQDP